MHLKQVVPPYKWYLYYNNDIQTTTILSNLHENLHSWLSRFDDLEQQSPNCSMRCSEIYNLGAAWWWQSLSISSTLQTPVFTPGHHTALRCGAASANVTAVLSDFPRISSLVWCSATMCKTATTMLYCNNSAKTDACRWNSKVLPLSLADLSQEAGSNLQAGGSCPKTLDTLIFQGS